MQKRYSNKYSFQNRKRHHKARHRSGGINLAFLTKLLEAFSANKMKFIAILVAVIAVVTVALVLLLASPLAKSAEGELVSGATAPVDSKAEGYNEIDTVKVDDEMLKGLIGEGLQDENTGDVSDAELKGAIGVVFDNVNSVKDTTILQKIERASASAIADGKIGVVKFYNAKGDLNQQLQDMRSMINSNAKVIVIDVADQETYIMMTSMAKAANIPVVAINAPAKEGYVVNIVEEASAYGQKSADFMKQKLLAGNILEIYSPDMEDTEQQRINLVKSAFASNPEIKSIGTLTAENKTDKIKAALEPLLKEGTAIDTVLTSQGMAKNVLNELLINSILPKVFCGDSTAGFMKMWHALKTEGITLEKPVEEKKTSSKKLSSKASPEPKETFVMKLTGIEAWCLESSPYGIGGTAIQFALRLAEGRALKSTALVNNTYTYSARLMITDANLEEYYQKFKDEADGYIISDWIPDADIDAMFDAPPVAATPLPSDDAGEEPVDETSGITPETTDGAVPEDTSIVLPSDGAGE